MNAVATRVLAIDYGDTRIGLAVSDPLGMLAQPLCTIENQGYEKSSQEVLRIASEQDARLLVVGLPLELDGSKGPQAKKTDKFARKLKKLITAQSLAHQVIFWDERMTSVSAERILVGSRLKGKERHSAVDRIAAAVILEGFLSSNR